jgi:hypothetical protein
LAKKPITKKSTSEGSTKTRPKSSGSGGGTYSGGSGYSSSSGGGSSGGGSSYGGGGTYSGAHHSGGAYSGGGSGFAEHARWSSIGGPMVPSPPRKKSAGSGSCSGGGSGYCSSASGGGGSSGGGSSYGGGGTCSGGGGSSDAYCSAQVGRLDKPYSSQPKHFDFGASVGGGAGGGAVSTGTSFVPQFLMGMSFGALEEALIQRAEKCSTAVTEGSEVEAAARTVLEIKEAGITGVGEFAAVLSERHTKPVYVSYLGWIAALLVEVPAADAPACGTGLPRMLAAV